MIPCDPKTKMPLDKAVKYITNSLPKYTKIINEEVIQQIKETVNGETITSNLYGEHYTFTTPDGMNFEMFYNLRVFYGWEEGRFTFAGRLEGIEKDILGDRERRNNSNKILLTALTEKYGARYSREGFRDLKYERKSIKPHFWVEYNSKRDLCSVIEATIQYDKATTNWKVLHALHSLKKLDHKIDEAEKKYADKKNRLIENLKRIR